MYVENGAGVPAADAGAPTEISSGVLAVLPEGLGRPSQQFESNRASLDQNDETGRAHCCDLAPGAPPRGAPAIRIEHSAKMCNTSTTAS